MLKKYEKNNQVYTVQEGSELEKQLIADGFEEVAVKKQAAKKTTKKTEEVANEEVK